ncbi:hypothetical protein Nepgr_022859 [Nepenthes gracilis]|uniref:Uncharacterized protein n=1 Tax=Nepenthes gracilis TaxID=150966 RepID=A0AAD3T2U4_NEPGR|nr:hypothetical protein Nepgr_022859 [Nepenthes gracilis]
MSSNRQQPLNKIFTPRMLPPLILSKPLLQSSALPLSVCHPPPIYLQSLIVYPCLSSDSTDSLQLDGNWPLIAEAASHLSSVVLDASSQRILDASSQHPEEHSCSNLVSVAVGNAEVMHKSLSNAFGSEPQMGLGASPYPASWSSMVQQDKVGGSACLLTPAGVARPGEIEGLLFSCNWVVFLLEDADGSVLNVCWLLPEGVSCPAMKLDPDALAGPVKTESSVAGVCVISVIWSSFARRPEWHEFGEAGPKLNCATESGVHFAGVLWSRVQFSRAHFAGVILPFRGRSGWLKTVCALRRSGILMPDFPLWAE